MLKYAWGKIHQSWMIVWFCFGIILGTVFGMVFRIRFFSVTIWLCLSVVLLMFSLFGSRRVLVFFALMSGVVLALFRISGDLYVEDYIRQFYEQTIVINGAIEGDPETDESGTKYKLVDLSFGENGDWKMEGSIYISGYKNEKLARGDVLKISGKLKEGFGTYVGYMYRPKIEEWSRSEPGDLVLKFRDWFSERIKELIPEPEASLGLSYLLGMKTGLPDDLSEKLRMVGLVHIVVASGAHLSILVEIARKIFGKLSRFAGLLFSILFIIFFMAMVGWTPSILRAGVMAILTLMAWFVGRKIAAWRMILIVAALTLMLNPNYLFNLGWLLSFASYGGIMILGPILTRFFYGEKKPGFISSVILTTIAATLMTLPIILYFYGTISLISVIANLLILPTLSYAMGLVFLTGVFAGIPGVQNLISFLAVKLLDFHILVVNFFGEMESFLVEISPENPWVFLFYGLIFGVIMVKLGKEKINFKRRKKCLDIVNGRQPKGKKP